MIVIDKNVMVSMIDGVWLATDVFRLQEAPPSPVLKTLFELRTWADLSRFTPAAST